MILKLMEHNSPSLLTNPRIMSDENPEKPLAPSTAGFYRFPSTPISIDDEDLSTELKKRYKKFRKRTLCCGIVSAVVLITAVIMLVLGFTVFHVKNPKIRMNSVSIIGLDQLNSTSLLTGNPNLTVVADVYVKNPNVAAFKYENSNSSLFYHNTVVGKADIPGGVAKARRTMRLNVSFHVVAKDIAQNPQFQSDLTTGILPVTSYTSIEGKVKILVIKRNVSVRLNCTIMVNVTSRQIVNQDCKRHISI